MTFEEFKARILEAGFSPTDDALAEMFEALPHLQAMRQRVCRSYEYADEPAHFFSPADR